MTLNESNYIPKYTKNISNIKDKTKRYTFLVLRNHYAVGATRGVASPYEGSHPLFFMGLYSFIIVHQYRNSNSYSYHDCNLWVIYDLCMIVGSCIRVGTPLKCFF